MGKNPDPVSYRTLIGTLIVTIVGTAVGGIILATIMGAFSVLGMLIVLGIVVVLVVIVFAVPMLRRGLTLVGRLAGVVFRWAIGNWQLLVGLALLSAVACGAVVLVQSPWVIALALGVALAVTFLTDWFKVAFQRRSDRPIFQVLKLPVGKVANANLEGKYLDLPMGEVILGGVRFLLEPRASVFDTSAVHVFEPDDTSRVEWQLPRLANRVDSVHFLINAGGAWGKDPGSGKILYGLKVGRIELVFEDQTRQSTELVLGRNVREWAIGNDPEKLAATVTDPACQVAWRGVNAAARYAVIDRLEIPIQKPYRRKKLVSIVFVRDIPYEAPPEKGGTVHFFVSAVTLELER